MYLKSITYTDYNGNERTETFMFNISRTEFMRLEVGSSGTKDKGFQAMVKEMIDSDDREHIFETFEKIVQMAYGVKSADGKRFMKSKELTKEFVESPAYDALIWELAQNDKTMSDFVNQIAPKELAEQAKQLTGPTEVH